MLEDPSFQTVVCWGPLGDCFVVKDMNEFTKSHPPAHVQALQLRELRAPAQQIRLPQGQEHRRQPVRRARTQPPFFSVLITPAYMRLPRRAGHSATQISTQTAAMRSRTSSARSPPSANTRPRARAPPPPAAPSPARPPRPILHRNPAARPTPTPPPATPPPSAQGSGGSLHTVGGGARRSPSPTHHAPDVRDPAAQGRGRRSARPHPKSRAQLRECARGARWLPARDGAAGRAHAKSHWMVPRGRVSSLRVLFFRRLLSTV